jgi:RNA polymerase sigma-70 factor, ECF subfamily
MAGLEDRELRNILKRAQAGEKEAFATLYEEYFTPIYRYLYFRLANKEEADDLVQDVFVKAFATFHRFSTNSLSPLPYFYTIARNSLIDYYRKKRPERMEEEEEFTIVSESGSIEEEVILEEAGEVLTESLALMPESEREILTLKFISGLTNPEVSQITGKNEAAIRQLQSRGLRRLREIFLKKYEGK